MKKLLLTASLVALTTPAYAAVPYYLSIGAGVTHTSDSDWDDGTDTGSIDLSNAVNFAAAIGANVSDNARAELEVSYRNADLDSITLDGVGSADLNGELKTTVVLLNGYYDFMQGQKFRPFISAGIGLARHSGTVDAVGGLGTPGVDATDTVFAFQAGIGASYAVSDQTDIWGGIRYLGSSDPDFDGLEAEYDAGEARIGLRFNF